MYDYEVTIKATITVDSYVIETLAEQYPDLSREEAVDKWVQSKYREGVVDLNEFSWQLVTVKELASSKA